ncbi:MAG: NAD(P)/FAD-dependent oxidoreductase [Wenzhouxiangella sp.]
MSHDVCVVGAGWSGLSAAASLRSAGLDVVVVEKARGPGGRCATRRQGGFAFDHGGQYFTARSTAFAEQTEHWKSLGLIAAWQPRLQVFGQRPGNAGTPPAERLVGVPGMNAVLKHMSGDLDCRFGWRAGRLRRLSDGWEIERDDGLDNLRAGALVVTAPPRQAAELLRGHGPLAAQIEAVPMNPCWALMLGFDQPLETDFDAAFDNDGPLAWLARNSSKPGRIGEAWLLHASAAWSKRFLESDLDWVAEQLLAAFRARVPAAADQAPALVSAHRWRYALAPEPLEQACLADPAQKLVVAGDWCAGNRIEGAWSSGRAAAQCLLKPSRAKGLR